MFVTIGDVAPFLGAGQEEKVQAVIDDVTALAALEAPCLSDLPTDSPYFPAVKALIRGAVVRNMEAGSGALQAQSAGPFSMQLDTRQQRKSVLLPSELELLAKVCSAVSGAKSGGAFVLDTAPSGRGHYPWCGSLYNAPGGPCDCGLL